MVSSESPPAGRSAQRQRTREVLLEAAARLVERGEVVRLAAVAREAGVSRATVYRYFASEQALLLEAPLAQRFAKAEDVLEGLDDASVEDRVLAVHRYVFEHARKNEAHFRVFLGAIHEQAAREARPARAPRGGRRKEMFDLALRPARERVGPVALQRLRDVLVVMTGIDALIAMKDVAGVSPMRARRKLEWGIVCLVRSTLGERFRHPRRRPS